MIPIVAAIPMARAVAARAVDAVAFVVRHWREALIVLLLATSMIKNSALTSAREAIAEARQAVITARDSLASANAVIDRLQAANRELAEGREADRIAATAAVDAIERHRDRLTADLLTERRARSALYANDPVAADWSRQPVPFRVTDRLRR